MLLKKKSANLKRVMVASLGPVGSVRVGLRGPGQLRPPFLQPAKLGPDRVQALPGLRELAAGSLRLGLLPRQMRHCSLDERSPRAGR